VHRQPNFCKGPPYGAAIGVVKACFWIRLSNGCPRSSFSSSRAQICAPALTLNPICSPGPDEPAAADDAPPAVDGDWSLEPVRSAPLGPAPPAHEQLVNKGSIAPGGIGFPCDMVLRAGPLCCVVTTPVKGYRVWNPPERRCTRSSIAIQMRQPPTAQAL